MYGSYNWLIGKLKRKQDKALVVNFVKSGSDVTADKTPAEVMEAMKTSPVMATLDTGGGGATPLGCFVTVNLNNPAVVYTVDTGNALVVKGLIHSYDGETWYSYVFDD